LGNEELIIEKKTQQKKRENGGRCAHEKNDSLGVVTRSLKNVDVLFRCSTFLFSGRPFLQVM
jgi:hypothetical protein